MININLQNINSWANDWLVKFNPNKTNIMLFSNKNSKNNLIFHFGGVQVDTVTSHKHLGIFLAVTVSGPSMLIL